MYLSVWILKEVSTAVSTVSQRQKNSLYGQKSGKDIYIFTAFCYDKSRGNPKNITERSPLTLWVRAIEEMNIKENIM